MNRRSQRIGMRGIAANSVVDFVRENYLNSVDCGGIRDAVVSGWEEFFMKLGKSQIEEKMESNVVWDLDVYLGNRPKR